MNICTKKIYAARYEARLAAKAMAKAGIELRSAHRCPQHPGWHLSRQRVTRATHYVFPLAV